MFSHNTTALTKKFMGLLKVIQRSFRKLFSSFTKSETKPTDTNKATQKKRKSSTKKLSNLFANSNKADDDDDDDGGASEPVGFTWFDDITRDLYQHLSEKEIDELMEQVEKDPDKKRKFQRYLKKRKNDTLAKKIRNVLELKLRHAKHLKYKKARNKKYIKKIIATASKRVHKDLNRKEKQFAVDYYKKHYNEIFTPHQLSHIALLGVISAHITNGVRPVTLIHWGKHFGIPGQNLFNGDKPNSRINYALGGHRGLAAKAVITSLQRDEFHPDFVNLLGQQGIDLHKFAQPKQKKAPKFRMR